MRRFLCIHILFASIFWLSAPLRACELALVLAVDVSASISNGEYDFQLQGLADATGDPVIAAALIKGQIALSVVQWSGRGDQEISISWRRMQRWQDVVDFAQTVRGLERVRDDGLTAIGRMMAFVAPLYTEVADCRRLVLDVSGDGFSNTGASASDLRDTLVAQGITINGIAIDRSGSAVIDYYRSEIIGGAGAFVVPARGYRDYPAAIQKKLFREVVEPTS